MQKTKTVSTELPYSPLHIRYNRIIKRTFDLVISTVALCTLFPVICLVVGIIIKLTSPGPIFFIQKRTGKDGKDFLCYKFRSMVMNQDADKVQATADDPRKTPFGNFIRNTSIDEIPQLINVFLGDMSLIGPRPHMVKHTDMYSKLIANYMDRHAVKPGITGWAQVTGLRGETKELYLMERRVEADIWYIQNWSLLLDLKIVFKTISTILSGDKNAY